MKNGWNNLQKMPLTKQPKISIFIFSLGGGGAEGVCINLANGFADANILVDLIVVNQNDYFYLSQINNKVNLIPLKKRNVRVAILSIYKYLIQNQPKKLVVFNYEILVVLLILKQLLPIKFEIFFRNITTFSNELKKEGSWIRKNIFQPMIFHYLKKTDIIINQSTGMEKDLLKLMPNLKHKSVIIHNPINQKIEMYAKSHRNTIGKKENYILFVGRLSVEKRVEIVVRVFKKIHVIFPHLKLIIVGKGDKYGDLYQLVVQNELTEHVFFEGRQNDIIPYYLKANLTILTSEYEGFPNVLVESIALGTPVVSFDIQSGPQDIIQNGINGFLIANDNEEEMVLKILEILNNPIDSNQVKQTAHRYHRDNILTHYINLLHLY